MSKKITLEQLDEKMREPDVAVSVIDFLISIGQIVDLEWQQMTVEQKLLWVKDQKVAKGIS